MKTRDFLNKQPAWLQRGAKFCALALGVAGAATVVEAVIAPAGTDITNQAEVRYQDAANINYTATSGNAVVTVAQVYNATIGIDDLTKASAPGQTVYFTHTLSNTGNGTDVYDVTIANNIGAITDSGQFTSLQVFLDGGATASGGTVPTNNCSGNNGQVDTGEVLLDSASAAASNTVTIPAGQQACLVIAAQIPVTAINADTFDYTLTTLAREGNAAGQTGRVDDITASDGADGAVDTNNGRVTVTTGPALQITKSGVHTPATATTDGTIAYTVEVQNTGGAAANDVFIFDAIPANTTLTAGSVQFNNATSVSGSDYLQTTAVAIDETTIATNVTAVTGNSFDLNGDGDETDSTETALGLDLDRNATVEGASKDGIFVFDDVIAPNTTVTLQYTVTYSRALAANTNIINQAHFAGLLDAVAGTTGTGETGSSVDVPYAVPTIRSVDLADTGTTATGDVDNTANDAQSVESAAEGSVVIFNNVIENTGNSTDTFTLAFLNDGGDAWNSDGGVFPATAVGTGNTACSATNLNGFPAGTTATFANSAGSPLGSNQITLAAGASQTIQVRIDLPSGINGSGEYCASVSATSTNVSTIVDYKLERLGSIVAPALDIANITVPNNAAVDVQPFDVNTLTVRDYQAGNPGDTVTFDVFIRNEGGTAESYSLSAGSTWDGTVLGSIPAGWQVRFRDSGNNIITSTASVAPGAEIQLTAEVIISSVAAQALPNAPQVDIDGDGDLDAFNGNAAGPNADTDNDYSIIFRAVGNNSGATDVVLDAVDVNEVEDITITTSQTGQVQPGGTITYAHTISNSGNTTEDVAITLDDSRDGNPGTEPDDFNPSILRVDTDCDGTPDTILSSITAGTDNVCLVGDTANNPTGDFNGTTLNLAPGQSVTVEATVSAKTSAASGVSNVTTVTASWDAGVDSASNTDTTEVVDLQLRIEKTAAIDSACDGIADAAFAQNVAANVVPGECVIWNILVTNAASSAANNVRIVDSVPGFTGFETGSLQSCDADVPLTALDLSATASCAAADYCTHTDASDAEAACTNDATATSDGTDITYYIGAGATDTVGGTLPGNDAFTVRFRVKVDEN